MANQRGLAKNEQAAATARLRARIIAGIHTGALNPGDRLPTYRELADEFGGDLRRVARAYRQLEEEGLVTVRGRSGVYVAAQQRIGGKVLASTARWMVDVLTEGWSRRVHVPDFAEFVRACVSSTTVRCACIEATEDQIVSLCSELKEEFGFETHPVRLEHLPEEPDASALPREVREAHLLVTTAYSSVEVRRAAVELEKPLVVARLSRELVESVERHLRAGPLDVVCVDPRFPDRVRSFVEGQYAHHVSVVLADDRAALRLLRRDRPALVTRAARERLRGMKLPQGITPRPVISRESAEELVELLVRFNLEAMAEKD